jgi:cell division septum initiation protein DivIVA
MDAAPFPEAARGFPPADVVLMLQQQMDLAMTSPTRALELLDETAFEWAEPGVDSAQVLEWMDAQRAWLKDRVGASQTTVSALDALSAAIDDLKRAIEGEAHAAVQRAAGAAQDAERRCEELVKDAERRLGHKLSQTRRKMREDAARIRREALDDAERMLERAGSHVAHMLIQAEQRERLAAEAAAQASAIQTELLNSIDAAQSTVSTQRLKAV